VRSHSQATPTRRPTQSKEPAAIQPGRILVLRGHRYIGLPTALTAIGVIAMFASSLLLAREASMAVSAVNDAIDHRHRHRRAQRPPRTS